MAATLLGLRIGGSECVDLSYMHLAVPAGWLFLAERQRVSRHFASLVNTFTNYDDVKGAFVKNSHRVREVTQRMSGFSVRRPGYATVRYLR
jgi:outer membrane lipoprotein-sorting protein